MATNGLFLPVGGLKGLALLTIQCDFDDTITVNNVGMALLERFAPDQGRWRWIEEEYQAGLISVEECNRRQYAHIKASREEIQSFVVETAEVRPGFLETVEYCRSQGMRFVVVSGGLDLYIEPVLRMLGLVNLEWYAGQAMFTSDGILVSYVDPNGIYHHEGFKLACLRHLRQDGKPIVYIGDGRSDAAPARAADHVIARDGLEKHFRSNALPCFTFGTFHDVQRHIQELRREMGVDQR